MTATPNSKTLRELSYVHLVTKRLVIPGLTDNLGHVEFRFNNTADVVALLLGAKDSLLQSTYGFRVNWRAAVQAEAFGHLTQESDAGEYLAAFLVHTLRTLDPKRLPEGLVLPPLN